MSRTIITNLKYALLAGASMVATSAWAQDAGEGAEGTEVEAITVVGSQIKGKVTDALPVTVLSSEDIDATGATSGDDLFRSIPQAGDVSFNEARSAGGINDARGDTASINLRGLGTGNTLMLLNGRRMVLHPAIQVENLVPVATVNANAIPVKGVSRVEVLRDGASAIYGTDAVAGVINTVLKSSFDGLIVDGEYSRTEDSHQEEYNLGFEYGHDFNGGKSNFSIFGQYNHRDPLWASERPFSRGTDLRPLVRKSAWIGDTDFRNNSTDLPWGEFQRLTNAFVASTTAAQYNGAALTTSGVFHVQPGTNEGCITPVTNGVCYDNGVVSTTGADENLRYNTNDGRALLGELDRVNLFSYFNHEFDNGIEFFGEAGIYASESMSQREQETTLAAQRVIVPITGYWNPFGPTGSPNRLPLLTGVAAAGVPIELLDYRLVDAGNQDYQVDQSVTRYLAGFRGEWRDWDWESAMLYSRAETNDTMRSPSMTLFQAALSRTDATAYNPFSGGDPLDPANGDSSRNPQAVIDSFMVDVTRKSHTSMALWDLKVSRSELFTLPAGGLGIAAGVEVRRETYGDDRDKRLDGSVNFTDLAGVTTGSDVMGVSPTPDTSGARNVQSAWLELAIPVVAPDMGVPLVHSLDLQLAARHENYSVFGSTTKPKIALSWYPFEFLQFRTAWSEGFRAPNLPQLYEKGVQRSNTRTDWIRCEVQERNGAIANFDGCAASVSVVSNRSGSTELTPEESENFTAGVTFVSTMLPREYGKVTLTLDYWSVEQTDIIGLFGDANALTLDYYLRLSGGSNPNVIRVAPTAQDVIDFTAAGLTPVGRVSSVVDNYRNLGPREAEGVDIGVFYEIDDTRLGDFDIKINAAKLLTFFQTPDSQQQAMLDAQAAGAIDPTIFIAGADSLIRENGRPEWRWSATVTWRKDQWGAGYYTSFVGAVDDTSATLPDGTPWQVDEMQTHNLYVQYTFDDGGWADGTRLRFGGRNIFNTLPPLADTEMGFMGELHSPRGATWYASVRKRF